jgi:hypothetical protein
MLIPLDPSAICANWNHAMAGYPLAPSPDCLLLATVVIAGVDCFSHRRALRVYQMSIGGLDSPSHFFPHDEFLR